MSIASNKDGCCIMSARGSDRYVSCVRGGSDKGARLEDAMFWLPWQSYSMKWYSYSKIPPGRKHAGEFWRPGEFRCKIDRKIRINGCLRLPECREFVDTESGETCHTAGRMGSIEEFLSGVRQEFRVPEAQIQRDPHSPRSNRASATSGMTRILDVQAGTTSKSSEGCWVFGWNGRPSLRI